MNAIKISLPPDIALHGPSLEDYMYKNFSKNDTQNLHFKVLKQTIDARQRTVKVNLDVVWDFKPIVETQEHVFDHAAKTFTKTLLIIGSGPAGLFAALRCIELGIKPIIIERGSDVRLRRRDLAAINKDHVVNPESNYCFGEGGAGTYSDGKLYTRSKKRGDIRRVLEILVKYGATDQILVDAHPHIGTNKLPQVVTALREAILAAGGEVRFNTKLTDIIIKNHTCKGIIVGEKEEILADGILLATGHSARDIFELLHKKNITLEAKPFALGVRIEHQQAFVDACQYSTPERGLLPAAAYSLVAQTNTGGYQRGVFSFCMCPGGFIVPSSTATNELVVNGMSPSRRDSRFANSGVVVAINEPDWKAFENHGPLAALRFQEFQEQNAFKLMQQKTKNTITQTMPAQKITDFHKRRLSQNLAETSYQPGLEAFDFRDIYPSFITDALKSGLEQFNNKMRGYENGQMIGLESRTSSPVRIPRDKESLEHVQIKGLFPCGEGAGYAGGIVSAAMDGERCAEAFAKLYG
jgi:uncharacterized protein